MAAALALTPTRACDHPRPAGIGQDLRVAADARAGRRDPRSLGRRAQAPVRPGALAVVAPTSGRRPSTARRRPADLRASAARVAQAALAAGWPTIVDAAFLRRAERAEFAALAAAALGAPFAIVDCRAEPLPLLRQRIVARQASGSDASEADVDVLERLVGADQPLDANELAHALVVDAQAAEPVALLGERWRAMR